MKKNSKLFVVLLTLILILGTFSACKDKEESEVKDLPKVPDEVQEVKDKVVNYATDYALQLNGEFGDQLNALIASNQGKDYLEYSNMLEKLKSIQNEIEAYQVYTLIDADKNDENYNVIINTDKDTDEDTDEDTDDFMKAYKLEGAITDATNGYPTASLSAWNNNNNQLCWSAYAPIYDSNGNITAILGIDYPCPEIKDYPEWNRDSDQWNKMHY
ncbi:hypothetical protein [Anaerovorax odorimutans]|uniref:hypothetical protein n=1 Tax=Anaerovorax odorimutans TaxID=109327 RepID=UPI0003FD77E6|nr:hypothetical protein [Anaerovorax odorimutans]